MLAKLSPRYGIESSFISMAKVSIASYIPICIAFFVSGFGVGGYYLVIAGLLASMYPFGKGLRVVFDFYGRHVFFPVSCQECFFCCFLTD